MVLIKMVQHAISLSFLILFFMFARLSISTANSNIYVQCSQLNFTLMTPYESNVNSLFTSLDDSSSLYNFNKFETSPQSDCVYGLFQCRGDLSSPNCKECVASAISQLKTTCLMSIGGEIQLEGCFVKYNDTPFFGADNKMEVCKRCGPSIGYNSDVLNRIDGALGYLVGGNGQYFREGDFGNVQGVAQCVEDLSLSDCQDCLLEASGRLKSECETSTWGDMYLGKCYIRYADQGNLNLANNNGNSASNKRSGKRRKTNKLRWSTVGIIGSFVVGGLTVTCAFKINILKRDLKVTKKEAESAKTEAKTATKIAEKVEKKGKEENTKGEPITYVTYNYIPTVTMTPLYPAPFHKGFTEDSQRTTQNQNFFIEGSS